MHPKWTKAWDCFLKDNKGKRITEAIVFVFDRSGGSLATVDLAHRYLWGQAVDQLLADEDVNSLTNAASNQVRWPLTGHLGTPRDWIDSSGALLDHAEYDAFGRRLDADAIDAAFEWTGRYRDPLTGLQYNNAHWYNPAIQRWMSEDIFWVGTNKYSMSTTPVRSLNRAKLKSAKRSANAGRYVASRPHKLLVLKD